MLMQNVTIPLKCILTVLSSVENELGSLVVASLDRSVPFEANRKDVETNLHCVLISTRD